MKESKHMDDELMPDLLAEPTEAPYIRPKGVEPLEIKKTPGELLLVYSPKMALNSSTKELSWRRSVVLPRGVSRLDVGT